MTNQIMYKLNYDNPPQYSTYESYREYLRKISGYSCAYCTISESESPGATFTIEHFRPKSLFPMLKAVCINLRYSCPRCNSYKSNLWISNEQGCIQNCSLCKNKVCDKNIERFIDCLIEDPTKSIYFGEDNKLYAYSGSNTAKYTIEFLRLNRAQLIKLRYVRRFMYNWLEELHDKRKRTLQDYYELMQKKENFELSQKRSEFIDRKSEIQYNMIRTMYDMMITHIENHMLLIDSELNKINHLLENRIECDEKIASSSKL